LSQRVTHLATDRGLVATTTRFSLVGVINTMIDFCVYSVAVFFGLPFFFANLISTSCGMAFSFFGNRSFTFKAKGASLRRQVFLFIVVTVFSQWVIQPFVIWIVSHISFSFTILGTSPALIVGKIAAIGFSFVWNFVLYNKVVFATRPEPSDEVAAADDPGSERA